MPVYTYDLYCKKHNSSYGGYNADDECPACADEDPAFPTATIIGITEEFSAWDFAAKLTKAKVEFSHVLLKNGDPTEYPLAIIAPTGFGGICVFTVLNDDESAAKKIIQGAKGADGFNSIHASWPYQAPGVENIDVIVVLDSNDAARLVAVLTTTVPEFSFSYVYANVAQLRDYTAPEGTEFVYLICIPRFDTSKIARLISRLTDARSLALKTVTWLTKEI